MKKDFSLETSIVINAPASRVWEALTNPRLVKQYLFGTDVSSDWRVGSSISYRGVYQGKEYHDKGVIKKAEPEKILQSTYWSSMSGKEDKPENYSTVTYRLSNKDGETMLTLTQDNIDNEKSKEHSEQNWKMVLQKLKEVVESEKK